MQREALEDALVQLHLLGALDEDGGLTEVGAQLAQLPVDPPLGRCELAQPLWCLPQAVCLLWRLAACKRRSGYGRCKKQRIRFQDAKMSRAHARSGPGGDPASAKAMAGGGCGDELADPQCIISTGLCQMGRANHDGDHPQC